MKRFLRVFPGLLAKRLAKRLAEGEKMAKRPSPSLAPAPPLAKRLTQWLTVKVEKATSAEKAQSL